MYNADFKTVPSNGPPKILILSNFQNIINEPTIKLTDLGLDSKKIHKLP
jgi:hypothetical protein